MSEKNTQSAVDAVTHAVVSRYGLPGVAAAVVGIAVFATIVWSAAHFAAAAGTPVSILWGFVQYTKEGAAPTSMKAPTATTAVPTSTAAPEAPRGMTTATKGPIRVIYAKPDEPANAVRAELGREYGLRDLEPLEAGKPIAQTPRSTRFFVESIPLGSSKFRPEFWQKLTAKPSTFSGSDYRAFLLQSGELLLLVYCSESDASRLGSIEAGGKATLTVSSEPWSQMKVLALISRDRFADIAFRFLDSGPNSPSSVLDIVVE